ncbi:MAG: serine/threonine protein kinase, partial [Planctomycetes bacterium]|nr:serine/threonine protein kinase [Planctomycetota bacterium]
MSADGSADEAAIEVLVAEALRQREEDGTVDLAKVCAGRPELLDAVAAALADAPRLAAMHAGALALDRRIGEQLQGRYVVDRRIGAGAMGVVYEARDTTLARTVAIKLLRQDLASDPHSEERFLREAQVLASIRHPAVVTLFDRGRTDDGAAFLVMERLNGHTAAALLQQGAAARAAGAGSPTADWRELLGGAALDDSDVRQAVRWLADAAAGLQAAHEAGVVHRDVKPSNLFIDRDGRAVLLDFGIGSLGAGSTALTATGSTLGTPAYMAPEQLNAADVGPATDVYGLGATLYEILTLEPAFADLGFVPTVVKVRQGDFITPRDRAPDLN